MFRQMKFSTVSATGQIWKQCMLLWTNWNAFCIILECFLDLVNMWYIRCHYKVFNVARFVVKLIKKELLLRWKWIENAKRCSKTEPLRTPRSHDGLGSGYNDSLATIIIYLFFKAYDCLSGAFIYCLLTVEYWMNDLMKNSLINIVITKHIWLGVLLKFHFKLK